MEQNKIVVSVKNGTVWTQIFDKDKKIVSSFTSKHEIDALKKAKRFMEENKDICIIHPELKNLNGGD